MRFPDSRILLFAKAPEPGQVKTRLLPALGEQQAAELYAELLSGVIDRMGCDIAPLQLWCTPTAQHPFFQQIAEKRWVSLYRQQGGDLGQRMEHAARQVLTEATSVLLIGGDCPVLDGRYLRRALEWLDGGGDAVLGPAEDGGYVLLGLRQVTSDLFENIPWGTGSVCDITRQRLDALKWQWHELEPLWDVDREEDLERYLQLAGKQ